MKTKDKIINTLLKGRFWFYKNFQPNKRSNYSPSNKKGYKLLFEDDFDEVSWGYSGENEWKIGEFWGEFHPDNLDTYYGPPKLIKGDSCALFNVTHKPKVFGDKTIPFEVSLLSSEKMFRKQYGRFECRMTLPKGVGSWPAFWLYGPTWPPEIDVIETYGRDKGKTNNIQEINLHYGRTEDFTYDNMGAWKIKVDKLKRINKTFYEFALEWHPDKIEIFVDNIKVFQFTDKEILDKHLNKEYGAMWVIIGHNLEPGYVNPEDNTYYSSFKVDYIRVYDKT
jgi:beta-glucanase (GH16 family)